MKILLINHYAGSPELGMEFRPYYMAREWINTGHDVLIVAASNSHVRSTQPVFRGTYNEENIDGVNYLWIKTPAYKGNGIKRSYNMLCFIIRIYQHIGKIVRKFDPDAVIASSTYPADIYPAREIAKKAKAKLIYEVHDLWPLSPIELGGMSRKHPFIIFMQWAENFAYKHVDKVVSMLPKTKEYMMEHGMKSEKWNYVPNGIVMSEWQNKVHETSLLQKKLLEYKNKYDLMIGYTGAHGVANALEYLLDAANILKKKNFLFVFIGTGSEKDKLKALSARMQLSNTRFFDPVPKNDIPEILSCLDILYIGLQKQSLFRFGISPNKLIDYMMSGKPVIQAIESGNDIVTDANCGISVEAANPKAIADAVLKLKCLPKEKLKMMGKNGKDFVRKNHDYHILADQFIKIIQ